MKSTLSIYVAEWRRNVTIVVSWVAAILALSSLILGIRAPASRWALGTIAFWSIAPPIWFFFEYRVLFDKPKDPEALADFKYMQELSTKFWAGLVATLVALHLRGGSG